MKAGRRPRGGNGPKDAPRARSRARVGISHWQRTGLVTLGPDSTRLRPGDEVFYAGDITRSRTNAAFHVVDERIVGRKPSSLGFAEAAGMPFTSFTAWEVLFDSFGLQEGEGSGEALLEIGGAGGVSGVANLRMAHELQKSGTAVGKTVLDGFSR